MKVLIVDDVDYIRKSIGRVLEDNNFICDMCENGQKAIEKLHTGDYGLIITDIMMPDMDGFEFLDFIRTQQEPKCNVPVLAISGGSKTINSDTALKIIEEKSNGILQKPFAKNDLLAAIAAIIGNDKYTKIVKGAAVLQEPV